MMSMPSMSACRTFAAAVAATVPLLTGPVDASAQVAFNGTWSVLIITDRGPCDRAYRYPVRVTNGRVSYAGQADFDVVGHVAANGAVHVTVSKGAQRASGSGRLYGGSGSGIWRGTGSSGTCTGNWTAEKRG